MKASKSCKARISTGPKPLFKMGYHSITWKSWGDNLQISAASIDFCFRATGRGLSLHSVPAAGGRIQEHVHQVVVQQIHLSHADHKCPGKCKNCRLRARTSRAYGAQFCNCFAHRKNAFPSDAPRPRRGCRGWPSPANPAQRPEQAGRNVKP